MVLKITIRALELGNLALTTVVNQLADTRVIIITIRTPVDEFLNPEVKEV